MIKLSVRVACKISACYEAVRQNKIEYGTTLALIGARAIRPSGHAGDQKIGGGSGEVNHVSSTGPCVATDDQVASSPSITSIRAARHYSLTQRWAMGRRGNAAISLIVALSASWRVREAALVKN